MKGDKKRKATFFQKGHKYIQSSAVKKSAKYALVIMITIAADIDHI